MPKKMPKIGVIVWNDAACYLGIQDTPDNLVKKAHRFLVKQVSVGFVFDCQRCYVVAQNYQPQAKQIDTILFIPKDWVVKVYWVEDAR